MIFGIEPASLAVGGVFGLLAALFGTTVKLLTATQSRSDRRNDNDVDRLQTELRETKKERDEYRDKWLDCLAEEHHPHQPQRKDLP